jgi:two-component system response regulator YesN
MIYSVLNEKGVRAHELFREFADPRLEEESANSIKGFVEWVDMVIEKTTLCLHDTPENKMAKAVKFIRTNLNRELSRETVAAQVYLNPDYFDRLFKKHYGCSVHQYIFREKIKIAVTLLADTETSVSDIAGMLGYTNVSNFSAMFKKATGRNPSDYRKKPAAP